MPIVKTIKADGTGDYTTLNAWWSAASLDAANADQWAEVYPGGSVGGLTDISGGSAIPDASHYVRIYAVAGANTNGTRTQTTSTIAFLNGGLSVMQDFARVEGLRVNGTLNFSVIAGDGQSESRTILYNGVTCNSVSASTDVDTAGGSGGGSCVADLTYRNVACYGSAFVTATTELAPAGTCTSTLTARFQSASLQSGMTGTAGASNAIDTATLTIDARNCIASNFAATVGGFGGTEVSNLVGDYNVSADATAHGAHTLQNTALNTLYTSASDSRLQSGAPAFVKTGGDDLSATFTTDIAGTTRPPGKWSIGALQAALRSWLLILPHNVFGG